MLLTILIAAAIVLLIALICVSSYAAGEHDRADILEAASIGWKDRTHTAEIAVGREVRRAVAAESLLGEVRQDLAAALDYIRAMGPQSTDESAVTATRKAARA